MRKYTILHTIETGGPGGAETVLLHLASQLDNSRFRSLVLLLEDQWLCKKLRQRGIPTFLGESKRWYDPRLPATMARLVRQERVDLIHSHLPGQNFYSCLVGRLARCRTIATYHGAVELAEAERLREALKLWMVRRSAAAVVAVCDSMAQLLRQVGFPAEKIVRIYNGVASERFNGCGAGQFRRELGCANGTKLIGMVANLRRSKGHEFFIRAARQVADAVPDAQFVAVGEKEEGIANRLSSLIKELHLQDRFYLSGFREDVPTVLKDLDVFVLPSVSEGFPLVILEAMAAGKPIVATRSGGPQEVVEDGRTGLLVPPADADLLAAKICELLCDPGRAAALGRAARAKVENTFSLERMVREYEHLYERCLEST